MYVNLRWNTFIYVKCLMSTTHVISHWSCTFVTCAGDDPDSWERHQPVRIAWLWRGWRRGLQRAMSPPQGQFSCQGRLIVLNNVWQWPQFIELLALLWEEKLKIRVFEWLLQEAVPFAVIGANTVIEVKGKKVRGRMYPWGVVEVENPDHCDFIKLRTMLM